MRDSIYYNLKYFIMKMSSTKPIKNIMKKSPLKQATTESVNASGMEVKPSAVKSSTTAKVVAKKKVDPGALKKSSNRVTKATPMMQMKKVKC